MYSAKRQQITAALKPLREKSQQAVISDVLQQGDIVEWILEQMEGPVRIIQTSFSIAEEYLRRIFLIKEQHNVLHLEIILDYKATQKTMLIWNFVRNVADEVYLCPNHSKVILVSDKRTNVSVITSQNLTRGNRNESIFITTDNDIFISLYNQIDQMKREKSVPISSLINGTSNTPQPGTQDNE